ncbi:MAG: signal peptidase I [Candidatus Aenigmarchaeota archaeon]|nr:signal peptidase I [Candidatus Aenigmarchaeota archaeon]
MAFSKKDAVEIIVAFAVAWVFYQVLAVLTGTGMPLVSVVSDSMLHASSYDEWWNSKGEYYSGIGISKNDFAEFPAAGGLECGDLLFVVKDAAPETGDIVIYSKPGTGYTIVHRVVGINDDGYILKGDNNAAPDPLVRRSQVLGKMVFAMPLLGAPRLVLYYIEGFVTGRPLNLGGTCSLVRL